MDYGIAWIIFKLLTWRLIIIQMLIYLENIKFWNFKLQYIRLYRTSTSNAIVCIVCLQHKLNTAYYILSFESPYINCRISSNPFLLFRCDISFNTKRFSSHITTVFGKGLLTITHKQRTKDGLIKFCNNWLIFAILVTLKVNSNQDKVL